ncbi:MAG: type II toxin-antitoxin system VapC family toxin [Brachymonas sp.]|nr:type II toxin-antitoxin system VapC family toxin [Brachymonas sp.]
MAAQPHSERYYLDTNTCVYIVHRRWPQVLDRLVDVPLEHIVIPTLVYAELAAGVEGSQRVQGNREALQLFVGQYAVEPWNEAAVWEYGRQHARLKRSGQMIGHIDLLLGCQAKVANGVMVTNNTCEFERIDGLRLENWAA